MLKTHEDPGNQAARRLLVTVRGLGMMGQTPDQAGPVIARPELTLPALREAVARVVPGRLPEMFEMMQAAFVRAGEENSVVPIHVFCREWAVVVEIERHPQTARRLHAAEQALTSDDAQVREDAIREARDCPRRPSRRHRRVTGPGRGDPHHHQN